MTTYLQKFNNYFHGIIAVPLLAFSVLYLEFDSGNLAPPFGDRTYYWEAGTLFVMSVFYILWLFRRLRQQVQLIPGEALVERLQVYFKLLVRFYVLMTLPGVVAVVLMYLTGEMGFSLVYILELFLLSLKRPHQRGIIKDLRLTGEDEETVLRKKLLTDV